MDGHAVLIVCLHPYTHSALRFLRARKFDLKAATEMYTKHMVCTHTSTCTTRHEQQLGVTAYADRVLPSQRSETGMSSSHVM